MATIKYKYNNEWRDLQIPISIIQNGGSAPSDVSYEYVEITGSMNKANFPDLSPYISDLSQIAFLSWNDVKESNASTSGYIDTYAYIYCPIIGVPLTRKLIGITSTKQSTNLIKTYVSSAGDSAAYTLGGTPSALKLIHSSGTESGAQYVGTINLYYKKEVE